MINTPERIFSQYLAESRFKDYVGRLGICEQNKINERFYRGDQWHGAACGGDKPLVRHNIIKRIGDFKISQLSSEPVSVRYFAEGFSQNEAVREAVKSERQKLAERGSSVYAPVSSENEVALMISALNSYRSTTAARVRLEEVVELALRDAYIRGTGIVYTYYDSEIKTGLFADAKGKTPILGDIVCERIKVEDIFFGDPACPEVQKQPYIILREQVRASAAAAMAEKYGQTLAAERLAALGDEKITLLTKLFKVTLPDKSERVFALKVTEKEIVRPQFDMGISVYPISLFSWERRDNCIYGDSEITYIIPNQIAINRMTTASVWSAMTAGMPLMVVNGDVVSGEITNEPGQIIKVFGTAEEIDGAVKFITPPDYSTGYIESVNNLISNTLTQCGANEASLGDLQATNTSAIIELREASAKYLLPLKHRYFRFLEDIALIWAEFFMKLYGKRCLKISDENGEWYFPFNAEKYSSLVLSVRVSALIPGIGSEKEAISILSQIFEKGGISAVQYISSLPSELFPNAKELIEELRRGEENERI